MDLIPKAILTSADIEESLAADALICGCDAMVLAGKADESINQSAYLGGHRNHRPDHASMANGQAIIRLAQLNKHYDHIAAQSDRKALRHHEASPIQSTDVSQQPGLRPLPIKARLQRPATAEHPRARS